jgi:hypothetical protein
MLSILDQSLLRLIVYAKLEVEPQSINWNGVEMKGIINRLNFYQLFNVKYCGT